MAPSETLEKLKRAVLEYDLVATELLAKKAIEDGIDPIVAADVLSQAIKEIGDGFSRGVLFIPDLIGGAEAMKSAMRVLEARMRRSDAQKRSLGTVVAGTVQGDIHDIGKSLVCTLLSTSGFTVVDLGVDVPAEKFVEAVEQYRPAVLAMSALLTTSVPELRKVIEALRKEGLRGRTKILVGGAPVNERLAREVEADGYSPTAIGAARLARKLLGIKEET